MSYLVDDLRSVVAGDAWHGPSWHDVLDGVTAHQAAQRVLPGTHTIYELVHHVGAWAAEVARRLRDGTYGAPADGDWPDRTRVVDDAEWQRVRERLMEAHEGLYEAIARFDAARMDERLGTERDPAGGTGVTYRAMIAGTLAHTAYHAGQAMLLRRAIEHGA